MRETIKDKGRIEHMLEMALNLQESRQKHTLEEIKEDKVLFFGLSKMIEIIGEAAYKLTFEFKEENTELPWKKIIGMRHILVHGYYTVSPDILWQVMQEDIPPMIPILKGYLSD